MQMREMLRLKTPMLGDESKDALRVRERSQIKQLTQHAQAQASERSKNQVKPMKSLRDQISYKSGEVNLESCLGSDKSFSIQDSHPEQGLSNIPYTLLILFENILMQENTLILFFWKSILKIPQAILDNTCDSHPEQGLSNIPYTLLTLFENILMQENTLILFFWKPILKVPQVILDNTCDSHLEQGPSNISYTISFGNLS
ncbi:hypothetical protein YC2023_043064 [Brassica napus]